MAADRHVRDSKAPPLGAHPQRARLTLPACLRLADSPLSGTGVFAAEPLPLGLRMGPYEGLPVRACSSGAGGNSWRVRQGRLVDAADEAHSNWMRLVNCAPDAARQNLAGFQYRGALYFCTVAPVAIGDELLIYYGDDSARNVDIDGCYDYVPPKEEPEPELATTDDGRSNGNVGNGYVPNIDIDDHCDYIGPKEEPEPELAATDGGGGGSAGDDYAHNNVDVYGYGDPPKEEPEPELCGGDGDAIDVNGYCYCTYGPPKQEQKLELAVADGGSGDGGAGDDNVHNIGIDIKDCHPPKEEPKLAATGHSTVPDSGRDASYDCSHCGVNLGTQEFKVEHELRCKAQMQRRELESQVTEVYDCDYCRCPFLSKEYKEQHQLKWCRKRPIVAREDFKGTYFKCDKCEYVTKRKNDLTRHLLNHNKNNIEWLTCTQCSYKTVHKTAMTKHMKIHDNTFSCCCPICGKSFRTKPRLDDHLLRQHSDKWDEVSKLITSKIHTCNICNHYRTIAKTSLSAHVALIHHKGVGCQKYECPRCPYSTFHKHSLRTHLKTHLEQKDYQCTDCQKQFTRKIHLDSHVLYYHADRVDLMKAITSKIHRCELCSFKTIVTNHLKSHVRSKHS